ncbi:MAG: c-type cytochrome [Methylobacillus sp.]|nr:c-type cytochrome [Methylobacillus sp.]
MSVLAIAVLMPLTASAECKFVTTKAGNAAFTIKPTDKDSPEAKKFLETCINPYTKMYVADPEAAKAGKKLFGYWSCTQCHGGNAGGQTGPSIIDDTWQYAKHQTDKGLFETIADGSDAGMPAWHAQAANNPELLSTDDILKIIGWLRAGYKGTDQSKPWLKE